ANGVKIARVVSVGNGYAVVITNGLARRRLSRLVFVCAAASVTITVNEYVPALGPPSMGGVKESVPVFWPIEKPKGRSPGSSTLHCNGGVPPRFCRVTL